MDRQQYVSIMPKEDHTACTVPLRYANQLIKFIQIQHTHTHTLLCSATRYVY